MIKTYRNTCIAFISLWTTGCIPTMSTYYEPQGSGVIKREGPCSMGVRRKLFLELPKKVNMTVEMIISTEHEKNEIVTIGLFIPKGVKVRFDDNKVALRNSDGTGSQALIAQIVHAVREGRRAVRVPEAWNSMMLGKNTDAAYDVEIDTGKAGIGIVDVKLPDMEIDDARVMIDSIKFTKMTRPHLVPLCQ